MRKLRKIRPALQCLGAGLVALDIVYPPNGERAFVSVGGSCGNVLSILNSFGMHVMPVTQFGYDNASRVLLKAFKQRGFDTRYVTRARGLGTPIVVQTFSLDRYGQNRHSFSFRCPDTGLKLPRFKPVSVDIARTVVRGLSKVDIFYSDRLSLSTQLLADACRRRGALILVEPSARFTRKQFTGIAPIAHVLKVSSDLINRNSRILNTVWNPLQIVTAGEKGLWYRMGTRKGVFGPWQRLAANSIEYVKDTAGSGDWSSAGIILSLIAGGWEKSITQTNKVKEALRLGQWLAAENCKWTGAQGLLYSKSFFQSIGPTAGDLIGFRHVHNSSIKRPGLKGRPIDFAQ